ncbi:MAG: NADH-quinone oxidoreductase subunit C [Planctomycetota bacterium]|nr:NADH-quinone oxidoreductase subunit C [Planctomycetota bacterium]
MDGEALIEAVIALEPAAAKREKADRPAVRVPPEKLAALALALRDAPALAFDMLLDHTAIDWLAEGRFELVYNLYSTVHGHSLLVTTTVPRASPVAPTVSAVWLIAHWQEREVFDLMGVQYDNHPDLRRLFLEDEWQGYPLRKDYKDDYMLGLPK